MWIKDRMIAGLCILILATPFYVAECLKDVMDKADVNCIQQEEDAVEIEESDRTISVYIAPTGECYHLKKTCAGKNAIETTLEKEKEKRACKKCVH